VSISKDTEFKNLDLKSSYAVSHLV